MKIPNNITPCPIIDALLEIRFESSTAPDAVFGIIFNIIREEFSNVEKLPIMQLPDHVRATDRNFKFKPYYRLTSNDFVLQIGPDVITISSFPNYVGWQQFSNKIFNLLNKINELNIIKKVIRIGLRYINFFQFDIYPKIDVQLKNDKFGSLTQNTVIRTEIEQEAYTSTLQIANNTEHKNMTGSVIDIDTFYKEPVDDFFSKMEKIIEEAHEKEKELFFTLLKKEFLASLNPKY